MTGGVLSLRRKSRYADAVRVTLIVVKGGSRVSIEQPAGNQINIMITQTARKSGSISVDLPGAALVSYIEGGGDKIAAPSVMHRFVIV